MNASVATICAAATQLFRARSGTWQPALIQVFQSEAHVSLASLQFHLWSSSHVESRRSWALNRRIDSVPESPSLWSRWQSHVPARSAILARRPPAQARRRVRAAIAEKHPRATRRGSVIDSDRTAASRACRELRALTVSGVGETGLNVLGCKIWEVSKNLLRRHPRRKIPKHVVDCNPHSANTRLAPALSRFNGDNVAIIHAAAPCREWVSRHYTHRFDVPTSVSNNRRRTQARAPCTDPSRGIEVIQ